MNTLQFTHDTIRMLGIHGLAIYMLMRCAEEEGFIPITRLWLLDHMPDKTSPNTVTAVLRRLTSDEYQIARRVPGGWRLNLENAFQLPLTYNLPEGESPENEKRAVRAFDPPIIIIDSPINDESLINNNNKDKKRAQRAFQIQDLGTESNSAVPSSVDSAYQRTLADLDALNAALKAHKIVGKKRDELLACEWVSAAYVHACVDFAQAEGRGEYAVGMAITRMLEQVDQPARRESGHIENCRCANCNVDEFSGQGDKYTSGEFAEYLNRGDEEWESHCMWQDELDSIFPSGHMYAGQHMRGPMCGTLVTNGSMKWCDQHLKMARANAEREEGE